MSDHIPAADSPAVPGIDAKSTITEDDRRRPLPARPSGHRVPGRRRLMLGLVLIGAAGAAIGFGYRYWTVGRFLESTDDAYVKADASTIAPKISGYIAEVVVQDNEQVKAGQLLACIDDQDFRTAVDRARADLAVAEAAIRNLDAQISRQHSVVAQKQAAIAATEVSLDLARDDDSRYRSLVKIGAVAVQSAQTINTTLQRTQAMLRRDRAAIVAEQREIDVLTTARAQAEAGRARNAANLRQAELNLSYTRLVAPVAGTVGTRTVRVGQFVNAGTLLMAIVPLDAVYVVANFKETQLTDVRDGQPARITVDAFPGVQLDGHVNSLAPASGQEFSLLPPDNATGNFTKIVQRVPVKITFHADTLEGRLRPGMSVEATIDTKPATDAGRFGKALADAAQPRG